MDGGAHGQGGVSRAGLFGRRHAMPGLRPPWSVAAFATLCDGCGRCLPVCPTGILVAAHRGHPAVDFQRGACTFCAACVQHCPTGALRLSDEDGVARAPWHATANVAASCLSVRGVTCRLCETRCDPDAIRFRLATGGRALPVIDNERCNGCGACVVTCPAHAIAVM